ncbi:MAG: PIN domain-containing protein [Sphingomonas sp.]
MTVFLDTNILLYSITADPNEIHKRDVARALIDDNDCALSVQVMNEFFYQATRPNRADRLAPEDAIALIARWRRFPVQANDLALFDSTWEIHRRIKYSWWDSAIVAAARAMGCEKLATEDLDHGRVIDSLRIENPFLVV